MYYRVLSELFLFCLIFTTQGQFYEDKRCKCICPSLTSISTIVNDTINSKRNLYIANVPPSKCNCDGVVLPHLSPELKAKEQGLCFRCECKYEVRNTTVIKVVVVMFLWLLLMLIVYMGFVICLEVLIRQRKRPKNYKDYTTITSEAQSLILEDNNDD